MKRKHQTVLLCGAVLMLALAPLSVLAQGGGGTGGGGTGGGGTGGGGTGGGGTGGGGSQTTPSTPSSTATNSSTTPTTQSSGGGSSTTTTAPAEGVNTVTSLTTKASVFSATSGVGTATSIPSSGNVLANTMVNPFSLGLPSLYATQYGAQNTISKTGGPKGKFTYLYVAPPTAATTTASQSTAATGFSTYGTPRNPVYTTFLHPDLPPVQHATSSVYAKVKAAVDDSSLKSKDNIQVTLEGATIVLRGFVGSDRERSIAEGIVGMTPGAHQIRNELVVQNKN